MRHAFCLLVLLAVSLVLQAAVIPAFLPPVLRPDAGILIGMGVLALGALEFGLSTLFLMGLTADILGSGRFGLLTLCYLIAAGLVSLIASRELHRGDFAVPCIAAVAGTALAHGLYGAVGSLIGLNIGWARATGGTLSLVVASVVWCLPCIYATGKLMYHLRVMSPEIQARWDNEARMSGAHRRRTA